MSSLYSLRLHQERLEINIEKWEKIIASSPEGRLICRKRGNDSYEYYYRDNSSGKEIYIPQSNLDFARLLAKRDYAKCSLEDALNEKRALDQYIQSMATIRKADTYLKNHPGSAQLILQDIHKRNEYIKQWSEAPYVKSQKYKDDLIHTTIIPDLKVRSKSEGELISRLVYYDVPFRYEEEHIIDGIAFYPDITCLNKTTLQEIYISHQGAWDNPSYVSDLTNREILYAKAGIIPWKNLIITTETKNMPLDINWVDMLIQYFLL